MKRSLDTSYDNFWGGGGKRKKTGVGVGLGGFCSKFPLLCYAAIPKGCSTLLKSSFIMPNLSSIILIVSLVNYHKNVLIQHIKPCVELRHSI